MNIIKTKDMTEEILNNVQIAKFMGIAPIKGHNKGFESEYYYYNNPESKDFEPLPNYSRDWNELMPVVEKINKRDWVTIYNDECKVHSLLVGEFEDIKAINEGEPLIKSVIGAVIEYIGISKKDWTF